ncbi:MAG: TRAP transporter large permease subunit [Rhodobacteraceae bacterium]|nr:TRAP transporter large permease subunit [Sedimentitalea sp.]MCB1406386.1 TRAP transporter large permease subunit [Paracoccaceae bacterium]
MLLGLLGIAAALTLMFLGLPVGYALAVVGLLGFAAVVGLQPALAVFGQVTFDTVSNGALVVLPLFLLMGNLVGASGMAADLSRSAPWRCRAPTEPPRPPAGPVQRNGLGPARRAICRTVSSSSRDRECAMSWRPLIAGHCPDLPGRCQRAFPANPITADHGKRDGEAGKMRLRVLRRFGCAGAVGSADRSPAGGQG